VSIPITSYDVLRMIVLLYASEQARPSVELLAAKYAPALHSLGPNTNWELRSVNALAKLSTASPQTVREFEQRYQHLLSAAQQQQQRGQDDDHQSLSASSALQDASGGNSLHLDGRVDIMATQELNALETLLRESRPYTVCKVIRDQTMPADLCGLWTIVELCERGRSDHTRRGSRNFHLYVKTVLMHAVGSRDLELPGIVAQLLPVCDFRFKTGAPSASAAMMNANKAKMQLSERVVARATDIIENL
jgi:hypothetical protein